jgi:hypothetical protein
VAGCHRLVIIFGEDFVPMEMYKLRMMGVPILGPTYAYGDDMSVIYNTQRLN